MTIEMYEDVMNHLQIDKYRELIIEQDHKITELEKACDETQELLDKQIEATYRLDKENAELKERNAELRGMYVHSAREAGTYKQFLELKEKENAELKEKYAKNITDCDICDTYCNSQLTKAKEIIKELMSFSVRLCDCRYTVDFEKTREEAEQFLNSEVEK